MNKKTNPWMIATIFLCGLIIGFGTGRIGTAPVLTGTQNPPTDNSGPTDNNNPSTNPPSLITAPLNSYNVEKSLDSSGHYSLGNKNSKVKIMEFSDFQCPFCYRYFSATFPQILKDYVATGKVYYSFYNFPLNIHPQAPKAAEASMCAGDQNKYWEYHDLLFANQNVWSGEENDVPIFTNLAKTVGMDTSKFTDCLSKNKYADFVTKDATFGDKKDISGTPTIFVNDQKIVGAQDYTDFKKVLDEQLNKK